MISSSPQNIRIYASVQPLAYIPPTWRLHVEASDNWKANDRENEPCASKWYLIAEDKLLGKRRISIAKGSGLLWAICDALQV